VSQSAASAFRASRDFLIAHREDYPTAYAGFEWPAMPTFNWALDHFDDMARGNTRTALWIVNEGGTEVRRSFDELRLASNRTANFLRAQGIQRGDRVLVMLPNTVELWEIMLAAIKLGAVISPATTLLSQADLSDRIERGRMGHLIADVDGAPRFADIASEAKRIVCGGEMAGWVDYRTSAQASDAFTPEGVLYFTSGTTSKPKMVLHTHRSYPVGHLSTMYWIGLREGDVHMNISSPGWAKHAWSSFFAPWNAGATIFVYNQGRFDAGGTLATVVRCGVTTMCAPPTAWRSVILEDLSRYAPKLRELVSAGEPLNPEVIDRVKAAWGLTIREGFGQTETSAMLGNPPGQPMLNGSMGKPLPGYAIELLDLDGKPAQEGEVSVVLNPRPAGVMAAYEGDAQRSERALGGTHYGTGDVATRDADGFYWFVGRTDDVFKSSDYRISPFELESALIEHEAVAEAAVVESPDARRLCVPKAFVVLKPGIQPSLEVATAILAFARERLAPYQKIRIIEFAELPKTVSGKIRRAELRRAEKERRAAGGRGEYEYFEADLPVHTPARTAPQ